MSAFGIIMMTSSKRGSSLLTGASFSHVLPGELIKLRGEAQVTVAAAAAGAGAVVEEEEEEEAEKEKDDEEERKANACEE